MVRTKCGCSDLGTLRMRSSKSCKWVMGRVEDMLEDFSVMTSMLGGPGAIRVGYLNSRKSLCLFPAIGPTNPENDVYPGPTFLIMISVFSAAFKSRTRAIENKYICRNGYCVFRCQLVRDWSDTFSGSRGGQVPDKHRHHNIHHKKHQPHQHHPHKFRPLPPHITNINILAWSHDI